VNEFTWLHLMRLTFYDIGNCNGRCISKCATKRPSNNNTLYCNNNKNNSNSNSVV